MSEKTRGFEIVSKYQDKFVFTEAEYNAQLDIRGISIDDVKPLFKEPFRATSRAAAYDIVNNTGADIILKPGETSGAITTYLKSYMQDDEVLKLFPRSGHGFKYLVRLANSVGIIDCDYYNNSGNEGEIFVKLTNPERSGKDLVIPVGEGMAQGMFQKVLFTDNDADTLGGERGGGIGSTNK